MLVQSLSTQIIIDNINIHDCRSSERLDIIVFDCRLTIMSRSTEVQMRDNDSFRSMDPVAACQALVIVMAIIGIAFLTGPAGGIIKIALAHGSHAEASGNTLPLTCPPR